jgi:hypothetical protein
MSELRTRLERLGDRVRPPADAYERLERARRRRERNRRITAGVIALLLAVAGSLAAFSAFRGGEDRVGGQDDEFFALWPEQTAAGLAAAQERVDAGDPEFAWRADQVSVAERFATEVLAWPEALVITTETDPPSEISTVDLEVPPAARCDAIVTDAECPTGRVTLTMRRLGRSDGLWSVTEVHGDDLALPVMRGDDVVAGSTISVPTNLRDGSRVSMGVAFLSACGRRGIDVHVEARGGTLEFRVPQVSNGCTGYVYAMRPATEVGAVAVGSFLFTDAEAIPAIGYLVQEVAAVPVRFVAVSEERPPSRIRSPSAATREPSRSTAPS